MTPINWLHCNRFNLEELQALQPISDRITEGEGVLPGDINWCASCKTHYYGKISSNQHGWTPFSHAWVIVTANVDYSGNITSFNNPCPDSCFGHTTCYMWNVHNSYTYEETLKQYCKNFLISEFGSAALGDDPSIKAVGYIGFTVPDPDVMNITSPHQCDTYYPAVSYVEERMFSGICKRTYVNELIVTSKVVNDLRFTRVTNENFTKLI